MSQSTIEGGTTSNGAPSYYGETNNKSLMPSAKLLAAILEKISKRCRSIMKSTIFLVIFSMISIIGMMACYASSPAPAFNHPFNHVEIAYAHDNPGCEFKYSPVDFCDERHIAEIKSAIAGRPANFNEHYILIKIKEWSESEYYGDSLVAIDTLTGFVYPMPFDYYSGRVNMHNSKFEGAPNLAFSINSNTVCIDGSILIHRAMTNGHFCFYFRNDRFSGYHTEYMYVQ